MQERTKQKLPIIIGVGLPLLLVLWIILFVYILPSIFVKPKYNFIYVTGYERNYVRVVDGIIQTAPCPYVETEYKNCTHYLKDINFYLYDANNDENIPLTLSEAKEYKLDSSEKSPDGYVLRDNKDSSGGFYLFPFFWGSNASRGYYIGKDGGLRKKISLKDSYYNFKFLGWILE